MTPKPPDAKPASPAGRPPSRTDRPSRPERPGPDRKSVWESLPRPTPNQARTPDTRKPVREADDQPEPGPTERDQAGRPPVVGCPTDACPAGSRPAASREPPSASPRLGSSTEVPRSSPRFCFTGEVSSPTSWGRMAREILMAARDLEMPLSVRPVKGYAYDAEYPLPDFLLKLIERPPLGKVQIALQPAFCAHVAEPGAVSWACTSFCIPPTPCEVKTLKGFQSIWVFSEEHRQALAKAGIPLDSIRALPLGVHLKTFHLRAPRYAEIPRDDRFRFLWIGNPLRRKAVDLVLRAYLEEFKAAEPVELVLKLTHLPRIKKQFDYEIPDLAKRLGAINALFPRVRVETGCWNDKDLAGLMTACQTLVSVDRAHFTGMAVREGMACGLPVIGPSVLTSLTGLNDETGWLVKTSETMYPEGILFPGSPAAPGREVDVTDLRRAMREAFAQQALTRRKGVEAARRIASGKDWRGAAERLQAEGALAQESFAQTRETRRELSPRPSDQETPEAHPRRSVTAQRTRARKAASGKPYRPARGSGPRE